MYAKQTIASLYRDCLYIVTLTPLAMFAILYGVFSLDVGQGDVAKPWAFIALVVGVTFVGSVGSACAHWLAGPGMRKMKPAEEAAKVAEIRAGVEARMAAHRGNLPMTAPRAEVALPTEAERAERYHTWGSTR